MLEMGECPPDLGYVNNLRKAGIQLSLTEYKGLAAVNRDDIILFNDAEVQRQKDDADLMQQEREKYNRR